MSISVLLFIPLLLVVILFNIDMYTSHTVDTSHHIQWMSIITSIFVLIHFVYSYCMYLLITKIKFNVINHLQNLVENKEFKTLASSNLREVQQLYYYLNTVALLLHKHRRNLEIQNKELTELHRLLLTSNKLSLQSLTIISNTKKYKNGQSE